MRCKQHASLCKHPTRFGNLLGTLIQQHHTNQNDHLVDILDSIHPAVGAVVPRAADGRLKDVGVVFAGWAEDVADVAHGIPSLLEPASVSWEVFGKNGRDSDGCNLLLLHPAVAHRRLPSSQNTEREAEMSALKPCQHCGKPYHQMEAQKCPNCGAISPGKKLAFWGLMALFIGVPFAFFVLVMAVLIVAGLTR